jgi:hypothetical protein
VILGYKKRWKIRYWRFATNVWIRHAWEDSQLQGFAFDAFVCHDSRDIGWITSHLLPQLEDKRGFKLCLAERDFIPGANLQEHIVEHIEVSRKTILIITPNFIRSHWCSFETSMALSKTFQEQRDIIIPIILQPLPLSSINKKLYDVLSKKLYLEWDESEDAQRFFWEKLVDALKVPLQQRKVSKSLLSPRRHRDYDAIL